ncbi:MAG: ATP-binding protein [Polyangiaceae bacterium]
MADLPLPELIQLRERIRDLEAEVTRLRGLGATARADGTRDDALIESEERFRVAFNTAPAGMSITRISDGRMVWVNPEFCRNVDRNIEDVVGRTMEEIELYADEDERQRIFAMLIEKGYVDGVEFRYKTRTGELRTGLLSSRPLTIGGEVYQLGMAFDITAAKRGEADRTKLEQRLAQAQKMEAVGRLAGGVAHDFNNMLTAIIANVELGLMMTDARSPVREHLTEIQDASRRAAQLTSQLLAFSKRQILEPRALDVSKKVDEMRSMLRRVIGENLALTFDLAPGLPLVAADPTQLEQVVLNLVVNARDACRDHGSIVVTTRLAEPLSLERTRSAGRFIVLSVSDDGTGIPVDVLPHVFEPFFSTKADRGTGLGLSTVNGIVTQHGGFVEVDSAPGRGTTLRVFLPEAASRRSSSAPPAESLRESSAPQGTLLLAEDDPAVREPTAKLLRTLGFTVLAAGTAAEILEQLSTHGASAEILLTDIVMPSMNGTELATAVRRVLPDITVVYMTGHPQDIVETAGGLEAGMVIVRKPFGAEQLLSAIGRARGSIRP